MATAFANAAPIRFINPDDMPDVYGTTGRGTCMMPLIEDGTTLVMDKRQQPEPGDTVALVFTREAAQRWRLSGMVKRLVMALPPADFDGLIVVEQLNPRRSFVIPTGEVLAVHKCVGIADSKGDGRAAWNPKQQPPRATAAMLGES